MILLDLNIYYLLNHHTWAKWKLLQKQVILLIENSWKDGCPPFNLEDVYWSEKGFFPIIDLLSWEI